MSNRTRPPRYKLAVVTWVGAYAVITLILWLLGPSMASWPLPLRTLAISVLMVITLTWLVIPALSRLFRPWLAEQNMWRRTRRPDPQLATAQSATQGIS
jgi:antibiotic biosynthesis monooxygenase (ABM) superfamily enzyme